MEYTKGEWKAEWHEITNTWNVIEQPGVGLIARCGSGKGYEANARLIASAPDLYEACKDIRQFLRIHGYNTDLMDKAIRKANGGN